MSELQKPVPGYMHLMCLASLGASPLIPEVVELQYGKPSSIWDLLPDEVLLPEPAESS